MEDNADLNSVVNQLRNESARQAGTANFFALQLQKQNDQAERLREFEQQRNAEETSLAAQIMRTGTVAQQHQLVENNNEAIKQLVSDMKEENQKTKEFSSASVILTRQINPLHLVKMTGDDSSLITDEEFSKPDLKCGVYQNPKSFTNWTGLPGLSKVIWWKFFSHKAVLAKEDELKKVFPVKNPDFTGGNGLSATWLGHATVLIQMDSVNFITDPVFAERASAVNFSGPLRYRPPPCKIDDLPELHFGVISHNHYDHLDENAVKQIHNNNKEMTWFVPEGLGGWMRSTLTSDANILELTWGELAEFKHENKTFKICCTPAQHWSSRTLFDRNKSLWCGWAVIGPDHRFLYTGDTGFCDKEFEVVGKKYGSFDLMAIPIGCYLPRAFMKSQHIDPEEAVAIHKLVKAKHSMGIHWGTYDMGSTEHYNEPPQLFRKAAENAKLTEKEIFTIGHGEAWHYKSTQQ